MADKRSELGKKINTVRDTIKQKSISDQMGEVEAEKLFKPITSGLRELSTPQIPLRRLSKKKAQVPDYGLEIGDDEEVPDYGLEDLFGEQVQPQNEKQLVPKPPSYDNVLEDIASGKKEIYIDPQYMYEPEDLPPEYEEEEEGPDYNIIPEDETNQVLDTLKIPNYNTVDAILNQTGMNDTTRKIYLNKIIKIAKEERGRLPGFSTNITRRLKKGLMSQAEAQYERKIIVETRKVLKEYIDFNTQKLVNIQGSGLKRRKNKRKRGGQIQFFNNPTELMKKLELIIGSITAGNNSIKM